MKMLDFNALNRPTLPLCMCDEAKTVITVTTPCEILVEELEATLPELKRIVAGKDDEAITLCYDLAARLISCNREGLQVTVDDLRTKYWPADKYENMLYLTTFFSAYLDYIAEINNAKKLTLPYYYPKKSSAGGHQYNTTSWYQHLVSEYTGLSLPEVRQLEYVQYLTWRRDAFIHLLSRTEAGQEYLDNAWRMEQTKPDRPKLRKKLGKEAPNDGE